MELNLSFWRDKHCIEIDLIENIISTDGKESPVTWEIKAGTTYSPDYFKNLKCWVNLSSRLQKIAMSYTQEHKKYKHNKAVSFHGQKAVALLRI